jgi:hypothetical protein
VTPSTTLNIRKKYGLWPPPDKILSGESVGELINQGKNGLTVIAGGRNRKVRSIKEHSENDYPDSELSEKEILQGVRKILDSIEVHHREWTGGRNRTWKGL